MEKYTAKQRPLLLTAYLVFMIVFSAIQIDLGWAAMTKDPFVHPLSTRFMVLIIQNIAYIICCMALFTWRRWGFWAICSIGILALITNLFIGGDVVSFIEYGIEVAILYFLLKTGGKQNAWDQLV
jgi:hypothetical protein